MKSRQHAAQAEGALVEVNAAQADVEVVRDVNRSNIGRMKRPRSKTSGQIRTWVGSIPVPLQLRIRRKLWNRVVRVLAAVPICVLVEVLNSFRKMQSDEFFQIVACPALDGA